MQNIINNQKKQEDFKGATQKHNTAHRHKNVSKSDSKHIPPLQLTGQFQRHIGRRSTLRFVRQVVQINVPSQANRQMKEEQLTEVFGEDGDAIRCRQQCSIERIHIECVSRHTLLAQQSTHTPIHPDVGAERLQGIVRWR
jgi:hypothetical protein